MYFPFSIKAAASSWVRRDTSATLGSQPAIHPSVVVTEVPWGRSSRENAFGASCAEPEVVKAKVVPPASTSTRARTAEHTDVCLNLIIAMILSSIAFLQKQLQNGSMPLLISSMRISVIA